MSKHLKYKSFGYVILTDFYSNFIYNMIYTVKKGFLLIYRHFQFPYFILSKKTIIFYTWKNGFHFDRIIFLILIIRYCNQIEIKMIFSPKLFCCQMGNSTQDNVVNIFTHPFSQCILYNHDFRWYTTKKNNLF